VGAKVKVSIAVLPADEYPPQGQRFFKDCKAAYGEASPDPYAALRLGTQELVTRGLEPDDFHEVARRIVRALAG
jgi:branched-chain amino acid transport system substrate-binding protein